MKHLPLVLLAALTVPLTAVAQTQVPERPGAAAPSPATAPKPAVKPAQRAAANAPKPQPMSAAECAVWKRELSFAQSVDRKDLQAFAAHLQQGAVFNAGSPFPVRGRDAIVKDWTPLIQGNPVSIQWRPGRVTIGGDSTIAISRGPFVMENKTPGAKPRFQVGTYSSVWVKGADGVWRVQFDGTGSQPMGTDKAEDVKKFMSRAPKTCA